MYAGEEKYVCSMYRSSASMACCGEHPEQPDLPIAPLSIMMAKVKPGWFSASAITSFVP